MHFVEVLLQIFRVWQDLMEFIILSQGAGPLTEMGTMIPCPRRLTAVCCRTC